MSAAAMIRPLNVEDRAITSGIEVSTMPRPMTGTAEASTSSAFCSIAAIWARIAAASRLIRSMS